MDADSWVCDDTGVYIADDKASDRSKRLLKTALEECVHWVTKASDNSRDLQDSRLPAWSWRLLALTFTHFTTSDA